jgi:Tfp pilus assembly protein PilN
MIQLNLLPDVKIEFLRTTRNKRLVIGISLVVIAVSVAVLLLLASIAYGFQKKNVSDLDKDIATYNKQLKDTPDLDKVLTIQNQLNALTKLHEDKADATRIFPFLTQLTPTTASISQFKLDVAESKITIQGSATSLTAANTFIDTLKFTTYQTVAEDGTAEGDGTKAFSNVVMNQFSQSGSGAMYGIECNYDPAIFNNASNVKLTVPKIISTRSLTEQPTDLFNSTKVGQ